MVEQNVEIERLAPFVAHENLSLESGLAEDDRVDEAKVEGPLLARFDGEILGAKAEVDLDGGLGLVNYSQELPLGGAGEAVLRES